MPTLWSRNASDCRRSSSSSTTCTTGADSAFMADNPNPAAIPVVVGSGATKTFSVRVRVIFQTPSMRRKALFKRLERSSAVPSANSHGCMWIHWPCAVSPSTWICSAVG
ncbi:Uncharacterised protein [Mycobacteroides abscessus subsp. abscessus]|nr:Uncharacterised protein [Mycobacteroides abscessus subsp. abscessus]